VDRDDAGVPQMGLWPGDLMATGGEVVEGVLAELGVQDQAAKLWGRLAEGAEGMLGAETWGGDGFGGGHGEIEKVCEHLQVGLSLAVAAGAADGEDRRAALEDHAGGERDAGTFAWLDAIGMPFPDVEALQARAEEDAGFADEGAGEAAGSGRDDVAELVGDD